MKTKTSMPGPLSQRAAGIDRSLGLVLAGSLVALVAGLFLPAITLRSMFLARDVSLIGSVFSFLENGDWFLFVVTFAFSVVFPVLKIATGIALWFFLDATGAYARPVLGWLANLSKWSMLDVFIIAVAIIVVDGRMLSSADIRVGAIVFSLAVLTSTWATRRLSALAGN